MGAGYPLLFCIKGGKMNRASERTKENLRFVDYRLNMLVGYALAISKVDFFVNEGVRTQEKQKEYYRLGTTKIDGVRNRSQHQLGKAIDIYYVGWKKGAEDEKKWKELIDTFRLAGMKLGIKLTFGYDWGWDKPHIELDEEE